MVTCQGMKCGCGWTGFGFGVFEGEDWGFDLILGLAQIKFGIKVLVEVMEGSGEMFKGPQ